MSEQCTIGNKHSLEHENNEHNKELRIDEDLSKDFDFARDCYSIIMLSILHDGHFSYRTKDENGNIIIHYGLKYSS